jgi:DNA-binding transcriptional ArsR family regulator
MKSFHQPDVSDIDLTAVLAALADPARLEIVRGLAGESEQRCGAIPTDLAKSTLSHHLRVLREAGVTWTRTEGTQRWVSLRREDLDARFPGLLDAVLAGAAAPASR